MPIHRLDEEPTVKATPRGPHLRQRRQVIETFIDVEEVRRTIDLHPLRENESYVIGMFLAGAYQEILGDLHNLFGDTNAVHVRLEEYGYSVTNVIKGDAIDEVLRYLQYDPEDMVERVRKQAERALSNNRMTLSQLRSFMRHYEESLKGYTYLTKEE
jgi:arginine decarboxylase